MTQVRRLITSLIAFIGVWVLVSFAGVMFDGANAGLWVSSLMWSLLSALVVMPMLMVASHASTRAPEQTEQNRDRVPEHEQEPFIREESDAPHTLWPESEQEATSS